ncbi:MAG: sigma-54-dependent Fis family transcriptional regulator [Alphaproteobacteria bacterium]|nr:sigma-54-dependent Fis family transcriptional regulator [Alphaproteobacteria bacterium]
MNASVLIVDDDLMQQKMLSTLLQRKLSLNSLTAPNGRDALQILEDDKTSQIKLIILDLEMPVMGGMETLDILTRQYPSLPVIMLTGSKDIQDATKAMKMGAIDFITKPYEGDRMAVTVKNALKLSLLSKEVKRLQSEKNSRFSFEDLIGYNGGLSESVRIGQKAAASDIPVLLTGETGVGKEAFAKAIHGESIRAQSPFIAINCGAIPTQLVESTLFGHEKGAFTGATEKTKGKFREAEGGTILLDEVGELPLDAQVKLLRVLQQKEVEPVGAAKPVPVNVRIISATNRDLQAEIQKGRFREDLYFRLNVLEIKIPPLRERKSDIALLTRYFIERICAQNNAPPCTIDTQTEEHLYTYGWPGNVRELENTINRAMVLRDSDVLTIENILKTAPKIEKNQSTGKTLGVQNPATAYPLLNSEGHFKTIKQIEQEIMHIALEHFEQNISKTAQALGIAKSTFYRKYNDQIKNGSGGGT